MQNKSYKKKIMKSAPDDRDFKSAVDPAVQSPSFESVVQLFNFQ